MSDAPKDKPDNDTEKRQREAVDKLLARAPVVSTGAVALANGHRLDYEVSASFMPLTTGGIDAQRGEPQAAVFTVAYMVRAKEPRPVCFAFNGGPGSASIWLHLGALGPKRVVVHDDGTMPVAPYAVQDNPLTWLEHFDLVFVDPPHTGYSVAVSDDARKKLFSVDGDVEALSEVVRVWLARHKRFGSALYLAGESYGTTRGAAIADKLQSIGLSLSGLILVSCAMDLQSLVFAPANDLPYALFLPAFANTAQFHGRLAGPLAASPEAARAAAEAFVNEDYLVALHAGARLDGKTPGRTDRPAACADRREEPAHQRRDLLLRAAARRGAHRWPARVARDRADGRAPHAHLGVRSRHRGAQRTVHDGQHGLLRTTRLCRRGALRGTEL
jgi:carboxypeptidase C (cathepsin A)